MPGSGRDDWPSRWAPPLTNAAKRRDNENLRMCGLFCLLAVLKHIQKLQKVNIVWTDGFYSGSTPVKNKTLISAALPRPIYTRGTFVFRLIFIILLFRCCKNTHH